MALVVMELEVKEMSKDKKSPGPKRRLNTAKCVLAPIVDADDQCISVSSLLKETKPRISSMWGLKTWLHALDHGKVIDIRNRGRNDGISENSVIKLRVPVTPKLLKDIASSINTKTRRMSKAFKVRMATNHATFEAPKISGSVKNYEPLVKSFNEAIERLVKLEDVNRRAVLQSEQVMEENKKLQAQLDAVALENQQIKSKLKEMVKHL